MADLGKVPGMRKNGEPMEPIDDIDALTSDQLVDALNEERRAWDAQGISPMGLVHDLNALDVQIMTVVWALIDNDFISEDDFNERYRRRMLKKLREHRSQITKAQITQGVQGVKQSRIIRP